MVETTERQPRSEAHAELDDLGIGVVGRHPVPEVLVDAVMVGRIALRVLGGEPGAVVESVRRTPILDRLGERLLDLLPVALGAPVEAEDTPVDLRDPQPDSARVPKLDGKPDEAWIVVIGICTHLGCIPTKNAGDYGGWFCPCHGSQYDTAGRIRKGPAPLNLALAPTTFLSPTKIRIG